MASALEQAAADLKMARFVVHKLGETLDSFQVHSSSIFNLADQWRTLQASFSVVHQKLDSRVQDLESKEKELCVVTNKLENCRKEIELKRVKLEFGEKSLKEKIVKVKKTIAVQKRGISEREKAVEAKEKELLEGLERVKKVGDDEARVRKYELEVDEWRKAVELEEIRVNKVVEEVESREKGIDERCKAVELRESQVDECCKAVELRESQVDECCKAVELRDNQVDECCKAVDERCSELESKEREIKERKEMLEARVNERNRLMDVRERELDEMYSFLELRENEIDEKEKEVKSKEKELKLKGEDIKLREGDIKVQSEELKAKEKDVDDRLDVLEVNEKDLRDGCRALEKQENKISESLADLQVREKGVESKEKELKLRENNINLRESDIKVQYEELKAKEEDVDDRLDMLEVNEKDLRDGCRALEKQENKISESLADLQVREKGVESKEKELKFRENNINLRESDIKVQYEELKAKKKDVDDRLDVLEVNEKDIVDRLDFLKVKHKDLTDGCKALDKKENEINERFSSLQVREEEVDKRSRDVDHKEMEVNSQCVVVKVKEEVLNEHGISLKLKEEEMEELRRGLELKEKQMNEDLRGLELKQKQHFEEMEGKEKEISKRYKEMEVKEKQINRRKKALELGEKQLEDSTKGLEFREKLLRDSRKEIELKEHEVNGSCQMLKQKESQLKENQELGAQQKNMELKGKQMKDGTLNLKLNQTSNRRHKRVFKEGQTGDKVAKSSDEQIVELLKVVDLKEKQDNDTTRKYEVGQKQLHNCNGNNEGDGSIFSAMDGKTLQLYLNKRVYKNELMKEEVVEMLKSMPNPAKLVLDAIDGFFSPHLSKNDVAFEASVVRSSCLLLLEHLMNMKPRLTTALKKKATTVALKWKANMWKQGESEDVVLAFLLLLITYNLTAVVNKNGLRRLCGIIDHHRLAPCIRQLLGLVQKVHGSSCIEDAIEEPIHSDSLQASYALDSSSVKNLGDIHSLCRIMDEHGVRSYLIDHVEEYSVLHDKILDALRYAAPDPAKLVLSVCQISMTVCDKNHADGTTCIILLKQLMKLSPSISHEVTNEAKKFAAFLRAGLKGSWNPEDHYRFLQFLASYKLANSYNPHELLSLFKVLYYGEEVYRPEENANLCFALGLDKKIPGVIKSLIDHQVLLSAVQYICVFKLEDTFPPVPLLETHLQNVMKAADKKRKEIDAEESMMLKSILTCISNFKLETKLPPDHFFLAHIMELEKEKESTKSLRKRSGSPRKSAAIPLQQEKRPRVGTVQQGESISPVYLPPCPPGPSSRSPHSFGPPDYPFLNQPTFNLNSPFLNQPTCVSPPPRPPQSYEPNLHFNFHPPFLKQPAYISPPPRPPQSYGLNPHDSGHAPPMPTVPAGMYPVCTPIPIQGVVDHAWTTPNQFRF